MRRPLRDRPIGPEEDRLFDLMRERAVHGLDDGDARELARLAERHADIDLECYDRAAAALDIVFADRRCAALPEDLKRRIANSAPRPVRTAAPAPRAEASRAPVAAPRAPEVPRAQRPSTWPMWSGWTVAAAATIAAILGWTREIPPPDPAQVALALQHDVDSASDRLVLPMGPTDDPDGRNVAGELHWSTALQKGYMRFRGLPSNDPSRKQYQLWIFDKPRGTDHPVDGGVFDVAAAEAFVPIDAKIRVSDPALFAVTAEPPGGVVVSKREHIVSLAKQ